MNRRALLILLGILAGLAIIVGLGGRSGQRSEAPRDQAFLPELKAGLTDLTGMVVTGPGGQVIATIVRDGDRWLVKEGGNYPADLGKLRQNLQALADARRLEEKTSSPDLYDRLGVADPPTAGSRAIQLDFQGARPIPGVIIGDLNVGGGERAYMRRTGEAASWLVSGNYDLGKTAGDWLDPEVIDLPGAKVKSVTIIQPGGEALRLIRTDESDPDFAVADLPPGRQLPFPGAANGIGGALGGLTLEGVSRSEVLGDTPPPPVVARFEALSGLVVEASAWRLADGTRFTFVATAPADNAEAKDAAEAINARVADWAYTLPSFKAELLTRRLADLLKDG